MTKRLPAALAAAVLSLDTVAAMALDFTLCW